MPNNAPTKAADDGRVPRLQLGGTLGTYRHASGRRDGQLPLQAQNLINLLGRFWPAGDSLWEIQLQVIRLELSPVYRFQFDNTSPMG